MDQGKKREPLEPLLKYGSLALQMVALIAFAAWAGWKIDQLLGLSFPFFLLLFVLLSFVGMIYKLYRETKVDQ